MNVPEQLRYTKDHEWVKVEGNTAIIGITDYAQGELGDIVFVELPQPGDSASAGEPFTSIEAVKAVTDAYAPVSGEISEVNTALEDDPQTINRDAFGEGWIIKINMSDSSELDTLLTPEAYKGLIS